MATVLAARQEGPGGVGRLVAVKLIAPGLAQDASFEKMFLREARIAARLEHPNIVRVYDVREVEGELLLTMEFVHGATLASLREHLAGPIPPAIALRIVTDVARGLHAAHDARDQEGRLLGLVHQDVSPQNVMVGYDGGSRLLDFGVARIAAEDASRTDTVRGKPSYLAPEQLGGERLDRRTDVFALGIVLYEALTGERLFRRETLVETHLAIAAHHGLDRAAMAGRVPPALVEVLDRALRRAPEARWESADALRRALESAAEASGIVLAADAQVAAWTRATCPPASDPGELEREIAEWESAELHDIADLPTEPPASRPPGTSTGRAVARSTMPADPARSRRAPFSAVAAAALSAGALVAYFALPERAGDSAPPEPPAPSAAPSAMSVSTGPLRCTVGAPVEPMKLPGPVTRLTIAAHDRRALVAAVAGKEARYSIATAGERRRDIYVPPPAALPPVELPPAASEAGLALATPDGFLLVQQRTHGPGHTPPPEGSVVFRDIDRKDGMPEAGMATPALLPAEIAGAAARPLTVYVAAGRFRDDRSSVIARAHMTVHGPHIRIRTDDLGTFQTGAPLVPAVAIGKTRGAVLVRAHHELKAYWFDVASATPRPAAIAAVGLLGAPALAFAGDAAVALWSAGTAEDGPSRLVGSVVRPEDGGWGAIRSVIDGPVSTTAPSIVVSDATLHLAWVGLDGGAPRVHVAAARLETDRDGLPKAGAPVDLAATCAGAGPAIDGPADLVQLASSPGATWIAWSHGDVVETAQVECR